MGCLSHFRPNTTSILACLPNNNSAAKPNPPVNSKPVIPRIRNAPQRKPKKQPSVAEVERAIGAGIFRDRDPENSKEEYTMFDMLMSRPPKNEGKIERKLRETGEWLISKTGGSSGSAGQSIFLVVCLWILPVWSFFLLVSFGLLKLPFSIPGLDDLMM